MIIGTESFITRFKYSRKYKPEEEFYIRLMDNPVYPFEDIGFGFFYLRVRSDRIIAGLLILFVAVAFISMFSLIVGLFAMPTGLFILFFCFGLMTLYGNLATRELIINREAGYLLRIQANAKILAEHHIHNVYIRLQEKYDTVGVTWYFLILGGFQLDDIRLSRMSQNQAAMRGLGRRLAKALGINYFDFNDTTTRHVVYHYSTYSVVGEGIDNFDSDEENEEQIVDYDGNFEDDEDQDGNLDTAIYSQDEYEKYVGKQLLVRQQGETEEAVLDEMYYNAVLKSGADIKANVSREEKLEFLNNLKQKKDKN